MASITSPNDHVPCTSGTAKTGSNVPVNVVSSVKLNSRLVHPPIKKDASSSTIIGRSMQFF